ERYMRASSRVMHEFPCGIADVIRVQDRRGSIYRIRLIPTVWIRQSRGVYICGRHKWGPYKPVHVGVIRGMERNELYKMGASLRCQRKKSEDTSLLIHKQKEKDHTKMKQKLHSGMILFCMCRR
ncbi:hypothetical protein, partial [Megasphaera cerevisiae]|uniref:hypothetical protein n=1 Tax=Megasphaera cerevisiae TaxID=39029 RepID=UPI001F35FED1